MNTAGIIIFTIDLLKALYTGFNNITQEKVVDLEEIKGKKHSQQTVNWQPYVGIGMMVIGGAVLVLGRKKSPTT